MRLRCEIGPGYERRGPPCVRFSGTSYLCTGCDCMAIKVALMKEGGPTAIDVNESPISTTNISVTRFSWSLGRPPN